MKKENIFVGILSTILILYCIGIQTIDPNNIGWLAKGDRSTHYLGWEFYRESNWEIVIGTNTKYGLELGNSIVYSDSIPLFAIIFKLITPILPNPFQYFGLWIALCFFFQGYFGLKIVGLATSDSVIKISCAAFFLLSPALLFRISEELGHTALAAHFFLLYAIYLSLSPNKQGHRIKWACLLLATAMTHAYLLAMTGAIWLVNSLTESNNNSNEKYWNIIYVVIMLFIMCTLAGYFSISSGIATSDYGNYTAHPLSFLDPSLPYRELFTNFATGFVGHNKSSEAYNYMGMGALLLIPFASFVVFRNPRYTLASITRQKSLVIISILFFLFSVSSFIDSSLWGLNSIIQSAIVKILGIFRNSGRFLWVPTYLILIASLFFLIRGFEKKYARTIILSLLFVQLVDVSPALNELKSFYYSNKNSSSSWATSLNSTFWTDTRNHYNNVRWLGGEIISNQNIKPRWQEIAKLASDNKWGTNVAYLARTSNTAKIQQKEITDDFYTRGIFDPNTLYILDDKLAPLAFNNSRLKKRNFSIVDGLTVYAPGWDFGADITSD